MTVQIKCSRCDGHGTIPLNGAYWDTLKTLAGHDEPITGADLASEMGVSPTAMCNRLIALQRLGLVKGPRYGRSRLWRINSPANRGD